MAPHAHRHHAPSVRHLHCEISFIDRRHRSRNEDQHHAYETLLEKLALASSLSGDRAPDSMFSKTPIVLDELLILPLGTESRRRKRLLAKAFLPSKARIRHSSGTLEVEMSFASAASFCRPHRPAMPKAFASSPPSSLRTITKSSPARHRMPASQICRHPHRATRFSPIAPGLTPRRSPTLINVDPAEPHLPTPSPSATIIFPASFPRTRAHIEARGSTSHPSTSPTPKSRNPAYLLQLLFEHFRFRKRTPALPHLDSSALHLFPISSLPLFALAKLF